MYSASFVSTLPTQLLLVLDPRSPPSARGTAVRPAPAYPPSTGRTLTFTPVGSCVAGDGRRARSFMEVAVLHTPAPSRPVRSHCPLPSPFAMSPRAHVPAPRNVALILRRLLARALLLTGNGCSARSRGELRFETPTDRALSDPVAPCPHLLPCAHTHIPAPRHVALTRMEAPDRSRLTALQATDAVCAL